MNIGIVGLGHLGKIHLKLLNESNSFKISGIFDINSALTDQLASEYQLIACETYDDLIKSSDAICIVTPTLTHFRLASLAIKHGKHIFIEKPATSDLNDTKNLIKLAREAGVIVQVGHVERFNPAFLAAKIHIEKPLYYEVNRLACYNIRGTDVSVVLDLMIHDIDLVLSSVKSSLKRISATGSIVVSKTPDIVNARLEFENGCVANITANRVALLNARKINVYQKNSYLSIDLLNKITTISNIKEVDNLSFDKGVLINTGNLDGNYQLIQKELVIQKINAIEEELNCFYESVINNSPIAVSLLDAESALYVAEEIEKQITPRH